MSSTEAEEEECGAAASTGVAGNLGFFQICLEFFTSVPMWGSHSSSLYGHTALGVQSYTSYGHTSGDSVSFPAVSGIFSSISVPSHCKFNLVNHIALTMKCFYLVMPVIAVILTPPAILTLTLQMILIPPIHLPTTPDIEAVLVLIALENIVVNSSFVPSPSPL